MGRAIGPHAGKQATPARGGRWMNNRTDPYDGPDGLDGQPRAIRLSRRLSEIDHVAPQVVVGQSERQLASGMDAVTERLQELNRRNRRGRAERHDRYWRRRFNWLTVRVTQIP